tara:strand:+ start:964 stop:1308 length:345 start_codon:yes stop_codon:yes gene_type:complete
MNNNNNNVSAYDFVIVVTPYLDKEKRWTGQVGLRIAMDDNNPLDADDFEAMANFTRQMCASVPLMEENKMFRDATEQIADKYLPLEEVLKDNKLTSEKINDNVIRVNFKPETQH